MRKLLPVALALCMYSNGHAADFAAGFAAGAQAYDGGRYAEAYAEWRALAEAGDARAQVAVAGMYRHGDGRPVDLRAAARWYREAAEAGNPIAQLNYAEMLRDGLGVGRDVQAARLWYDRAARQGNAWAADRRDALDGPNKSP